MLRGRVSKSRCRAGFKQQGVAMFYGKLDIPDQADAQMMQAVAAARRRIPAAELHRDFVQFAKRPVAAGGVKFEDRTHPHLEAVVGSWRRFRRQVPDLRRSTAALWQRSRIYVEMPMRALRQHALATQSHYLTAYGRTRTAQASADLRG
jgi:hypothetical protein